MSRAILVAAVAVALFACGWWQGRAAERAAWTARAAQITAERDRAAARVAGLTEALAAARAARGAAATRLEEEADADNTADRMALPARSLQRIDAR